MTAREQLHQRQRVSSAAIESLEPRRLLSTWATVDQLPATSGAVGVATDNSGDVFVAGYARNPTTQQDDHLVRRSADAGTTWSSLQDPAAFTEVKDIAVSGDGNTIFLVGCAPNASGSANNWIVSRSTDGGVTWSTVDQFALAGSNNRANAITADAAGNLYVVGQADAGSNHTTWIVRRSQDGGTTWSTVDSISGGASLAAANGVFVSPTEGIFVAGVTPGGRKGNLLVWTVRRSLDGGNTWATVDSYQLNSSYDAMANSLGADAAGNLYAVGWADSKSTASLGTDHWTVRKSTNGGGAWTTVDDFAPATTSHTRAARFAKDSAGNLYVVGQVSNSWVVRSNPLGQGAWSTVDQLSSGSANAIGADGAGHVFVAGNASGWIVRETSVAPAAATALSTSAVFSPVAISSGSATSGGTSLAANDDTTLTDQLFGNPMKQSHAHGR